MNDKKQTFYQLQGEVHGFINMINTFMKPLLVLISFDEGHGLSPFCHEYCIKEYLIKYMYEFFP